MAGKTAIKGIQIGQLLIEQGVLSATQVEHILAVQKQSHRPFGDVRKHLRRFLLVESGTGKQQYFRFYDPRVLRGFLPTCGPRKIEALFEEIEAFALEAEDPGKLLRFTAQGGKAIREESTLEREG